MIPLVYSIDRYLGPISDGNNDGGIYYPLRACFLLGGKKNGQTCFRLFSVENLFAFFFCFKIK